MSENKKISELTLRANAASISGTTDFIPLANTTTNNNFSVHIDTLKDYVNNDVVQSKWVEDDTDPTYVKLIGTTKKIMLDTWADGTGERVLTVDVEGKASAIISTDSLNVVDNLTTPESTKPLSANQGVEVKALIDAIGNPVDADWSNPIETDDTSPIELEILSESAQLITEGITRDTGNEIIFIDGDGQTHTIEIFKGLIRNWTIT